MVAIVPSFISSNKKPVIGSESFKSRSSTEKSKIVQANNINIQVFTMQQQYNVTKSIPEGENL